MKNCAQCQKENKDGANYCGFCGAKIIPLVKEIVPEEVVIKNDEVVDTNKIFHVIQKTEVVTDVSDEQGSESSSLIIFVIIIFGIIIASTIFAVSSSQGPTIPEPTSIPPIESAPTTTPNGPVDISNETVEETLDSNPIKSFLQANVGKYPRFTPEPNNKMSYLDANLWESEQLITRLKAIMGTEYETIIQVFYGVTSPIVNKSGIYEISGCKVHDCLSSKSSIFIDTNNDQITIHLLKDGQFGFARENFESKYKEGSYSVSFHQFGGMNNYRIYEESAWHLKGSTNLVPVENYVLSYINIPGDHVWVTCASSNYRVVDPQSFTNNFTTDSALGVGMVLEDQLNQVYFICEPIN